MDLKQAFVFGFIGFAIVAASVPLILRLSRTWNWLHRPSDLHHTHTKPVPRLGGVCLALAALVIEVIALVFYPDPELLAERIVVIVASLAVFVLGFWDDIRPIGAKWKLLGQMTVKT